MNKQAERANKQATKSLKQNKSSPSGSGTGGSTSQEARELQPPHKLF